MKYTEFEKKVKEIPEVAEVTVSGYGVTVEDRPGRRLLDVSSNYMHTIYTAYESWRYLSESTQAKLYKLAYELASTPLEEREEPKKYYYRLPYMGDLGYLNYDKVDRCISYSNDAQGYVFQTQFTREEYAEIAKDHGIPEGAHLDEEVE